MKKYIIFIIPIFLFGCANVEVTEFTDSPIIEAYLGVGEEFSLKVSRQLPFSSGVEYSSDNVDNLTIELHINGDTHLLTPVGDGVYIDDSIIVEDEDVYDLSFEFNSKQVKAYTFVPSKPVNTKQSVTQISLTRIDSTTFGGGGPGGPGTQPDPIEITWDNTDNSNYLVLVENVESTLDPIRDFGDQEPPGNIFRKSPTTSNSEQIRSLEFQYFGLHRIIVFHVLPDYASLYDENSTSSQNLSNPSTSIINGYGIFTGLNSDTLWIEVKEN